PAAVATVTHRGERPVRRQTGSGRKPEVPLLEGQRLARARTAEDQEWPSLMRHHLLLRRAQLGPEIESDRHSPSTLARSSEETTNAPWAMHRLRSSRSEVTTTGASGLPQSASSSATMKSSAVSPSVKTRAIVLP